jgi:hypothetical protein
MFDSVYPIHWGMCIGRWTVQVQLYMLVKRYSIWKDECQEECRRTDQLGSCLENRHFVHTRRVPFKQAAWMDFHNPNKMSSKKDFGQLLRRSATIANGEENVTYLWLSGDGDIYLKDY